MRHLAALAKPVQQSGWIEQDEERSQTRKVEAREMSKQKETAKLYEEIYMRHFAKQVWDSNAISLKKGRREVGFRQGRLKQEK